MSSVPPSLAAAPYAATRYPGLDGLRALAVTLVIVYHLFPGVLPGGFVGVDVFFVISGFLITSLLLTERASTGRISLQGFWARRARRLLPALGVMVLVTAAAAWAVGGDLLVGLGWQLLGAVTFGYNWLSLANGADYFAATSPELYRNLWSLAIEEQFYLIWPLIALALVAFIPARGLRVVLVGAWAVVSASAMAIASIAGADATRVYFGTDTHSFGLLLGAAVAFAMVGWGAGRADAATARVRTIIAAGGAIAALAMIVAAAVLLDESDPFMARGGLALVCVATAAAAVLLQRAPRLGAWLDGGMVGWIGRRSYGLYLWHWPVFVLVAAGMPAGDAASAFTLGVAALALTVIASALSYKFIEQPVRRYGFRGAAVVAMRQARSAHPMRRTAIITAPFGATALIIAVIVALGTAPTKSSAESFIERGAASLAASAAPSPASPADATPPTPDPTDVAVLPAGTEITAVGDSVMLASAPELQAAFPGITIDATVSRSMQAAPDLLASMRDLGQLRDTVVVGLGTNGPFETETLERVLDVVGPERQVVLVDAFADRDWTPGVNSELTEVAARHRNVDLAGWSDAIAPHVDILADDGIHPGPTGAAIYTECVRASMERLVALPPAERTREQEQYQELR